MKQWIQTTVMAGTGVVAALAMIGCGSLKSGDDAEDGSSDPEASSKKSEKIMFLTDVKPLLENYCLRCHNTGLLLGDLNLETRKLAFTAGEGGPFIIPKHPEASKFYQVLKLKDGKEAMPPAKHRMSKEEREIIYRWIEEGADWPKDSRGTLRPMKVPPTVAMAGGSW